MLNYWWVTRPKRKLDSVPEVLATIVGTALNAQWEGNRGTHLSLEDALEKLGLKRAGERRDQTAGGGRTYAAWISSLGLTFKQESTGELKLTLAGEAILNGDSPVAVLKNQILKYQFPSAFSLSRGVRVSERFRIRPFRFLLRLLTDNRIGYLFEEEIAKIVIVEAENETEDCYENIVSRIETFRTDGDKCLNDDFLIKYASSKGTIDLSRPYGHLMDIANTLVNWLEYTQLVIRDRGKMSILEEKAFEVSAILSTTPSFIDRPEDHEFFQRKYGVDPKHTKDTRNLTSSKTITAAIVLEHKIKQAFISEALKSPVSKITADLICKITEQTGVTSKQVEETLQRLYPAGMLSGFMSSYYQMAFSGRDEAVDFEFATVEIFKNVFGLEATHVGRQKLHPDVFILSDSSGFVGIIDNKAYSKYTISNDHRNRMVHNYIKAYVTGQPYPLAFFSYISGGFGTNIDDQIRSIADETAICGSAISVSNMINLVENYSPKSYDHAKIREVLSINRQVRMSDI